MLNKNPNTATPGKKSKSSIFSLLCLLTSLLAWQKSNSVEFSPAGRNPMFSSYRDLDESEILQRM